MLSARRNSLHDQRSLWGLLPERVQDFLRESFVTMAGGVFALLGLAAGLALVSFSIADPSLNNATASIPQNIFGTGGAVFADLALQLFGVASFVLILPLIVWGWWLVFYKSDAGVWERFHIKLIAWILALGFASLTASCLPLPTSWPFVANLGGLLGDGLASVTAEQLVRLGAPLPYFVTGLVSGLLALTALTIMAGISRQDFVLAALAAADVYYWTLDAAFIARDALARVAARRGLSLPGFKPPENTAGDPQVRTRRPQKTAIARPMPAMLEEESDARNIAIERVQKRADIAKSKRENKESQTTLDLGSIEYKLPPLSLLTKSKSRKDDGSLTDDALEQNARMLEDVLQDFGIRGEIIQVRPGPVVTLYELHPAPGIKAARVIGLADDIARNMSAVSARVAVVPGRNVIGIELPNQLREMVYLRDLLASADYENTSMDLPLALGHDIGGQPIIHDITGMPHLLVAGTTGSGKSVSINTMILSLLYRLSPEMCRLILIDPKMLELSVYDGIPHLLAPVVTDPKKAVVALKWVVREMEDRYRKMSKVGVRNIHGFNDRVADALETGEVLTRTVQTGFDHDTGKPIYETEEIPLERMPFIVVVIDEMADLMMVAGKDIESAVQRLAQMARAAGIHLIMATQRPSVDVITGTIKANFPTRISFQVTSKIDSRTILGEQGAEQLLGQGDMLFMAGGGRINRVHGPFVSDQEVEKVVRYLKKQGRPEYLDAITQEPEDGSVTDMLGLFASQEEKRASVDELYDRAVAIVAHDRKASTSYIQRKLQIGYNRAARIIEQMEEEGVVSQANHAGKREVLVDDHSGY